MWYAKSARALALVALGGGLGSSGCRQAATPIQPSIFTNPNELALVCFSNRTQQELADYAKSHPDFDATDPTLPLACCNGVLGDDSELDEKAERCGGWDEEGKLRAVSHALVTQVQRGEVAAVDLEQKVVLDSDKRIPGYTFIDVGGLPTAIAVRSGQDTQRPRWTYVAGRERNSLRAVATCRFKTGIDCGGEESERALAGEPFDMHLSGDQRGLWLTLPNEGLLAYVPLPEAADDDAPFAGEIVYYPLPNGFDAKPTLPPRGPDGEPEPEPEPYRFACRFDESKAGDGGVTTVDDGDEPAVKPDMSDPAPWEAKRLKMPDSVAAVSKREAHPTLLRMVDLNARGESTLAKKLLFVADDWQMAVHVYEGDAAGNLALLASMPVGAPLRDFAVTPEVPKTAPSYARLLTGSYYDEPRETTRYLYGIDQRDGSLMAFSLTFTAGVPKLEPLRAPTPARDGSRPLSNRADRLSLGRTSGLQARALDVIDTRQHRRADGSYDDAHCQVGDRAEDLERLETEADEAQEEFETRPTPRSRRDWLVAADDLAVPTNAGAGALRGVFLSVAMTNGGLAIFDIHDLDLECRAKQQCATKPEQETGVVIARHTPRMSGTEVPVVSISPSDELAVMSSCPDGYEPRADGDDENRICVSKDAWLAQGFNFTVVYEGAFTSAIFDGVLEDAGGGKLWLNGPQGVDLCARGAHVEDGNLVGILSQPDDAKRSGGRCEATSFSSPPRLRVLEASRDRLLLEPLKGDDVDVDAETLLACYQHLVAFDLRLYQRYLVRSDVLGYQHRNYSDKDGTCTHVDEEELDERFTSVAPLEGTFKNQFVSFELTAKSVTVDAGPPRTDAGAADAGIDGGGADEDGGAADEDGGAADEDGGAADEDGGAGDEDGGPVGKDAGAAADELSDTERARRRAVNPNINISTSVRPINDTIAGAVANRNDVLPHRVRYFPDNNYLFVVDQASQGLRRFFVQPTFKADDKSIFR